MKNKWLILILVINAIDLKAQENKMTFGLQYKPIIPAEYFNSSYIEATSADYTFNLNPKYSNSFGMIIRHKVNKTFSIESALNYTQRNYTLKISNEKIKLNDFTSFGMRSYEIPLQLLTYVRVSEFWYLNVAFGLSHNILASDIYSDGKTEKYYQKTYRKNGGYRALLANIGVEYRTEKSRSYYIGTSLHRPWGEISRIYPGYKNENNSFNQTDFKNQFFLDLSGNFITIDFRYFFAE